MAVQRQEYEYTDRATIQAWVDQVVAQFQPEKVILFGSYAYDSPRRYSDVDVAVIMDYEGKSYRQASTILLTVRSDFPVDLLVIRPADYAARLAGGDIFVRELEAEGIVLYESHSS